MEKLGVMVVGPGWVAGQHLAAFAARKDTEVRVIAGNGPEDRTRARGYCEKLGLSCDYVEDYGSALRREDVDVVCLCTPNYLHYEQAAEALAARKHVLLEKPMALKLEQAKDLVALAEAAGVRTHVGHVVRYYDAVRGLWQAVRGGEIGEVYYCEAGYWHEIAPGWKTSRAKAGDALLMAGCHAVDMVCWMMGEERRVRQVFAWSVPARRRTDFEYEPTMGLLLRFDNGSLGQVGVSLESRMPYSFHLQVNGTRGAVQRNGLYSDRFPGLRAFVPLPADYPDDAEVSRHPFPAEIEEFITAVREERESSLSFARAYPVYEVAFAAERSVRLGRPVDLPLSPEDD
ncbi:MAG TPA: Gfo/Idh/MocA family oxidoreductase [Acidobacteriota bacterium]|nr:Gfo/Idh/MocA family oxidoreductase [Acidobacteriota bacterium]HRR25993.1 Gfo/Idh/MocA family oxidoreductase [Acidobacteriota bacterium]HRV07366.1 Gfo/Idh/MocA family oxidoreductase [Acidobacteriota bacterium]